MKKARILIVEDEAIIAMEIESQMQSLGYEVTSIVNTGEEAIGKADSYRPDIILMDIDLRGKLDGIESAEIIRTRFNIPIVFLTAHMDEDRLERAKLTLPFGYLLKPTRERDLKVSIEMALYISMVDKERSKIEEALQKKTNDLDERVKEINCLYAVSELVNTPDILLEEIIQGVVDLIPPSMQYPDITCSRITIDEQEYKTKNFKLTSWKLTAEIFVRGKQHGIVEICYLEKKPKIDDGPFLKEEKNLINAISERLGKTIERNYSESELKNSESRYLDLYDNAPDMYASVDAKTACIVECNQTLINASGYTREEIIGRPIFDMYTPESAVFAREEILPTFLKTGKIEGAELKLQRKDGSAIDVSLNVSALRDSHGNIISSRSSWRDISEQKQLEKDRFEMEQQLFQAQKMESLGTLSAGIAHDFNNLQFQILGYTQLAINNLPADHELKKFLLPIEAASNKAAALVKQILSFSRSTLSEFKPLLIQPVIKEVLKLLRSSIPTTIEIRQDISDTCGPVSTDIVKIYQVVMNLCTNARQAIGEKKGILGVTLDEIEVNRESLQEYPNLNLGNYVKLVVSDNGQGMDAETKTKIFNPFFTTKKEREGTGLGLSIVQKILEEHRGSISVVSSPGKGTTFTIFLPRVEMAQTSSNAPVSISLFHGTEKIMIVDDEHSLVAMEQELLQGLGYQTSGFISSPEALQAFQSSPLDYDLVITDETMPELTGSELAEHLLGIRPDIPIILMTGNNERITEEETLKIGIRKFFLKPTNIVDLARTIRGIFDNQDQNGIVTNHI